VSSMPHAPTPPVIGPERATALQRASWAKDVATTEPGGCSCDYCGEVFIGGPGDSICGICRAKPCPDCGQPPPCLPNCGLEPTYDNRIL
jgi:hypothetical protein